MSDATMRKVGIGLVIGGLCLSGGLLALGFSGLRRMSLLDVWWGPLLILGFLFPVAGTYIYQRISGAPWWQIVPGIVVAAVPLAGPLVILVYMGLREFGLPIPDGRTLAKRAAAALAIVVLGPLLAVFVTTHGADLYDRITAPPPDEGFVIPEDALPDDDALAALEKLGEPIHQIFESLEKERTVRHCGGLDLKRAIERPCAERVLQQAAGHMAALDAWMAGNRHKLDRPANLGQHLRVQGIDFSRWMTAKIPNYLVLQSMGRALAYRAILRSSKGDQDGARQDLQTLFALGVFLQQNPLLIGQMVGVVVSGSGLAVLDRVSSSMPSSEFEAMLPAPQAQMEGIHYAFRTEWRGLRDWTQSRLDKLLWTDVKWLLVRRYSFFNVATGANVPPSVWNALGLYSPSHTHRLLADRARFVLAEVTKGNVVNPSLGLAEHIGEMCDESLRWVRNPLGRALVCESVPLNLMEYAARTGVSADRVAAMKVVLAARRFKQKTGRWPVEEQDLVPAYLPAWPVSVLDRQPIRWMADRRGVQMLKEDGKTLCDETEPFCLFLFEPPAAVRPMSKPVKSLSPHR